MERYRYVHFLRVLHSVFTIGFLFLLACGRPPGLGIGGRYLDGRAEVMHRGGNINQSIVKLEEVVQKDPFYRDSLTLLGGAYYKESRYRDALEFLKRALAVKQNDEIAWISLGLTQLRLGDDENGLKTIQGGLTLFSKASKNGYRGFASWDKNGLVRAALRRAILQASKGLEQEERIIQSAEALLARIDEEKLLQERERVLETQVE